ARPALRTNFYQRPERPVVSIKVDSRKVEGMPSPRPMVEIYVHSPLLEGIHLRGGKVARGGIRWSDRHDDFRTEILGLMKTQMVKNSIIVPVGSKGGVVLKGQVPARPALDAYLVDRYRQFVSGLLDVTDNIVDGQVLPPPEGVRHAGGDPPPVRAGDQGHIFVDPEPDAEKSFAERERLFRLPRSSWRDYNPSLISRGGGTFERAAKAIPLSPQMKGLLGLEGESASGEEVVRRILT